MCLDRCKSLLLHLTGHDLPIEQLKWFHQFNPKTLGVQRMGWSQSSKPPPTRLGGNRPLS